MMKIKSVEVKLFICLLILFASKPILIFSQNVKEKTLAINFTGLFFNDFSLFYETDINAKKKLSLSAGYMISNRWWAGEPGSTGGIEVNDDKFPIGAVNGPQFRIGYFFKKNENRNREFYSGPQLILKYLFYNNFTFVDFYPGIGEKAPLFFTRDESTFVTGAEWMFEFKRSHKQNTFHTIFIGVGGRVKFRNIHTTDSHFYTYNDEDPRRPIGYEHRVMWIPTFNFGIKIGGKLKVKSTDLKRLDEEI